jgi:quinol monooxygenase YgiN
VIILCGWLICANAAQAARVSAALPEHVRLSREEPGCLRFDVSPDTDDPLIWRVQETFESRAALAAHQARAAASDWARATAGVTRAYTTRERTEDAS